MEPLIALVAEPSLDLSPLTQKLWAERIPHRVVQDNDGKQCVLLANPADIERVRYWVEQWRSGDIQQAQVQSPVANQRVAALLAVTAAPVSAVILLLLIGVFIWQNFSPEWQQWVRLGSDYWPNMRNQLEPYLAMGVWELWRPAILHFSLMHIVFNGLWWWILASKIERLDGVLPLLVLMLVCGLAGNIVQWWSMGPNFGGASGITMGLLGWVGIRLKQVSYQFPSMLLPVMVGVILFTMAADTLFSGITHTAHGAHIGGLVAGLALGKFWPSASRP